MDFGRPLQSWIKHWMDHNKDRRTEKLLVNIQSKYENAATRFTQVYIQFGEDEECTFKIFFNEPNNQQTLRILDETRQLLKVIKWFPPQQSMINVLSSDWHITNKQATLRKGMDCPLNKSQGNILRDVFREIYTLYDIFIYNR